MVIGAVEKNKAGKDVWGIFNILIADQWNLH